MSDETVVTGDGDSGDKQADAGDKSADKIFYGDDKKADDKSTTNDPAPEGGDDKKGDDKPDDKVDDKSTTDADDKSKGIKPVEVKDLKVPKDVNISEAQVEKIAELSTKHKLSTEAAQEILDSQVESRSEVLAQLESEHESKVESWIKDIKSDTELGGTKFKESAEQAQRVVKKFGSEKLTQILNETGYGNHPELVRTFARIGRAMADDKLITGTPVGGNSRPIEDVFYGSKN